MNYYEKEKTDKEERIIYISLRQARSEFKLELEIDTHEGLSNVEDLNTLLEPTHVTDVILKRWKTVHQIDPEYPYPETEIKERDWMGMNRFLHGKNAEDEGNKQYMIYDEEGNIDSDVFDYIMLGMSEDNKNHPIVSEAEKIINH